MRYVEGAIWTEDLKPDAIDEQAGIIRGVRINGRYSENGWSTTASG